MEEIHTFRRCVGRFDQSREGNEEKSVQKLFPMKKKKETILNKLPLRILKGKWNQI